MNNFDSLSAVEAQAQTQARLESDRRNRERALDVASFIVEAPAGAGKTELLTQRYLRLLAEVKAPEEILAMTFTNKAAAEMRHRILDSLQLGLRGELPQEAHKQMTFHLARQALQVAETQAWGLLEQPARLRIVTIDSLCASLARQMPFLSRFGAQPRMSDRPVLHYAEAAQRTLALLDADIPEAMRAILVEALRYFDNDGQRLSLLLVEMLAKRDQWLRHAVTENSRAEAEQGLRVLVEADLAALARRITPRLQTQCMSLARYAAGNLLALESATPSVAPSPILALLDWHAPLMAEARFLPQWRGLAELLLKKDGEPRQSLNKNIGFPAGKAAEPYKTAMQEILQALSPDEVDALLKIRSLPDPCYSAAEWRMVEVMAQLLRLAAAQLWSVFNTQGEADFVEIAQRALQALGSEDAPTDLALQLDYKIQHLLVDEFQDTSPSQVQLLQALTRGWQAGDGRTLFAVGDPMQSIYRFRKADVGLFLRAAEQGFGDVPLENLRLYRNNRSAPAVVDWINQVFDAAFPAEDVVATGAIRYRPFVAARPALSGAEVKVHPIVLRADASSEAVAQAEAERILALIGSERAENPEASIAVLVRARSHLEALLQRIRSQQPQLRFQAVEMEGLAARQPVLDLLSLTRALHQRADRVHWLAVLRAPWCGLCLADLHVLAADQQSATLWQLMNEEARVQRLSADGQVRLKHVRRVFSEAFAHQGRSRRRHWLEGVWLKLGGAACLCKPEEGADTLDVEAFFNLLEQLDNAGRFTLERLEAEVAELYAAPDALADGRLQFMTIHKSKGLEFDTVILPGLHHKSRSDDASLMLWEEVAIEDLDEHLIAAPLPRRETNHSPWPRAYDYLRQFEQERSSNESTRVLYVAVTRAVRRLHLLGVAKLNAQNDLTCPKHTFLSQLWPQVAQYFELEAGRLKEQCLADAAAQSSESPDDSTAFLPPFAPPFVPPLLRTTRPVTDSLPQPLVAPSPSALAANLELDAESMAPSERLAASVGVLLHAYLELLTGRDLQAWDSARIRHLASVMRLWFTQRGFSSTQAQEGATRVAEALQTTLNSPDGRWLLCAHQNDAAELSLCAVQTGNEQNAAAAPQTAVHIVDRSFIAAGQRWVVDYKTAQVIDFEKSNDVAVLHTHAERYRPQLERYARLFAHEDLPQKWAIFYARYGRLLTLH